MENIIKTEEFELLKALLAASSSVGIRDDEGEKRGRALFRVYLCLIVDLEKCVPDQSKVLSASKACSQALYNALGASPEAIGFLSEGVERWERLDRDTGSQDKEE